MDSNEATTMNHSAGRKFCKRMASSFWMKPFRNAHLQHADDTHLPALPKMAASLYCIVNDYGEGLFPPVFTKETLYASESHYIRDQVERVESSIRSPFCVLEGRPYMNRQKIADMVKFFGIVDGLGLPPRAKFLEVGGGTGWLSELLCVKGYDVVTTTLAAEDVEVARLRCDSLRAKKLDTTMTALSAPMEHIHDFVQAELPFDVAFCHGALHHAYSWQETIQSLKKCLRPGGVLLLTDEPAWHHTFLCYRSAKIEGRHEVGFFKKTLVDFLKSESFQIVQTGRRWSLSLPLWIVARLAP